MNISTTLDPKLGGKIRSTLALIASLGLLAGMLVNEVDWTLGVGPLVLSVLSVLAHWTKLGNVE